MTEPKDEPRGITLSLSAALWARLVTEAERLGFQAPEELALRILTRHPGARARVGAAEGSAPLDAFLAEGWDAQHQAQAPPRRAGIDFAKIQERTREPASPYVAHLVKGR